MDDQEYVLRRVVQIPFGDPQTPERAPGEHEMLAIEAFELAQRKLRRAGARQRCPLNPSEIMPATDGVRYALFWTPSLSTLKPCSRRGTTAWPESSQDRELVKRNATSGPIASANHSACLEKLF